MEDNNPRCLYCNRSSDLIPLLAVEFQKKQYWICPQHLPILIHEPGKLAGHLPGMQDVTGAEHDH